MIFGSAQTAIDDRLKMSEQTFVTWDGTELFYRAWLPPGRIERALFLLHRGHEHSGRFADLVPQLGLENTACFAWDQRGHGRSPGQRGYAPSFAAVVKDLDWFVRAMLKKHELPMESAAILGHSIAAVTAAAWVHDYAPPIRALVLLAPALRVKLYVPLAIPGLRCLQQLRGHRPAFVTSYVRSTMLTHDRQEAEQYDRDPLIAKSIAVNMLLDLHDTSSRLLADAAAIQSPTLLLSAGKDWVVRLDAQRKFFNRLRSTVKRMQVFDGMHHDLVHEAGREQIAREISGFLRDRFEQPVEPASLVDADQRGYTKQEYDRLRQPLPALSPKRWWFAAQRLVMSTAGRLSEGVRLGWETGFDSGKSLDYVYRNQARGRLLLGRWADRSYLNAVGWRGIRQRKENLQKLLRSAIDRLHAAGRTSRVLDIAAGCGRYVLETIAELPEGMVESVVLRDRTAENLAAGRQLADALGLQWVQFSEGDAFDETSLAAISPPANLAIVSGLYELFPDNSKVLSSLRGVAGALREGGFLIYTGQPWHPQLEMIARVLDNRDGQRWIMRRRTQAELDALVRAAGFEKIDMEIDRFGIFTVSLARIGSVK
ncbi:MAG TPA: bifunctional alpha/beta hydrolase/class I SAM-dependent methyltransferase [Pirellulaceae bacterium]|nr:bifunctional alpha/beta hydrolase/class I SAM-dependent methyltransferase [Pirellulaceae bacterium]